MTYKDKMLTANYIEFLYPFRFVEKYKGIEIVEVYRQNKKYYSYTIYKNRECTMEKLMFKTVQDVKKYISSYDHYLQEDREWFLVKEG